MMQNVVVVGAGMMGSGIAAVAALAGNKVTLVDQTPEGASRGREKALACVRELRENGLADAGADAAAALRCETDLALAVQGAQLVIEAIYEDLPAKQALFQTLDTLLPAAVPLLSNTSGLRITDIAAKAACHPERTMTAHFWLPAHLVPLVEVVLWERTDRALAQRVRAELAAWGKQPVIVNRDLPGQLANRILQAIIREAANIVDMGLASAADVDTAIKAGMGIRFPAWGPLEHVDAVGLDLCLSVQENVLPGLSADTGNPAMRRLVEQGALGSKTGRGFYDWTERDMDALAAQRNAFIIAARKALQGDPETNKTRG